MKAACPSGCRAGILRRNLDVFYHRIHSKACVECHQICFKRLEISGRRGKESGQERAGNRTVAQSGIQGGEQANVSLGQKDRRVGAARGSSREYETFCFTRCPLAQSDLQDKGAQKKIARPYALLERQCLYTPPGQCKYDGKRSTAEQSNRTTIRRPTGAVGTPIYERKKKELRVNRDRKGKEKPKKRSYTRVFSDAPRY